MAVHGGKGVADNGSMVRIDIFHVADDGYYLVPIYVADTVKEVLPSKACVAGKVYEQWPEIREEDFLFSLYTNDLISIEDRDLQFQMANQIFDNKLSVRETEKLVRKLGEEKEETTKTKEPDVEIIYRNLEEKVKEILGTKVQISHKKNNSGKIEIEYYSNEELERIIELLESVQNH